MSPTLHRRTVLLAALAATGCSAPSPSPSPSSTPPPPAPSVSLGPCASLESFDFEKGPRCGSTPAADAPTNQDLDFTGPVTVRGGSVAAVYRRGVVEWDATTGKAVRLLADGYTWHPNYAWHGLVATNRCDGVIVVHKDGCVVAELDAHDALPADPGVQDLQGGIHDLGMSPEVLVSLGGDGQLKAWDVMSGQLRGTHTFGPEPFNLTMSPDGSFVAVEQVGMVTVLDVAHLEPVYELRHKVMGVAFHPDGKRLYATADDRRSVHVVDLGQRAEVTQPAALHGTAHLLAVGPDHGIAYIDKGVALLGPDGKEVRRWAGEGDSFNALAFSADGATLFVLGQKKGLVALDVATAKPKPLKFEIPGA